MDELHVVTEVGMFGDLDIEDPTKKKIKKKKKIKDEIEEAIQENLKKLGDY